MAKIAKGSSLFILAPMATGAGYEVLRVRGVTDVTLGGTPKDEIDITDIDEPSSRQYTTGLATPAAASFALNLDQSDVVHQRLFAIFSSVSPISLKFALGWNDGTALPTVGTPDANGNVDFVLPASRTFSEITGNISDFPFNFQVGALIKTTVGIKRSGDVKWINKSA